MLVSDSRAVDLGAVEAGDGDGEDELEEADDGVCDGEAGEGGFGGSEFEGHGGSCGKIWGGGVICCLGRANVE